MNGKEKIKAVVEAGIFIAITFIVGRMEVHILPQGGSLNIAALPLAIYAVRNGVKWGVTAGAVYGVLILMWTGFLYHPLSGLLDFIIPPAAMGLAGLFKGNPYWGIVLGCTVGMVSHILSGVIIFGHFMPDVFLESQWEAYFFTPSCTTRFTAFRV